MGKLNKYKLEFDCSWIYIEDQLKNANALSTELLDIINFKNGYFFTLLPSDANFNELYNFTSYGILPQYPEMSYNDPKITSTYQLIPSMKKELAEIILKEIESRNRLSCLIDDVKHFLKNVEGTYLFDNHALLYEEEISYLLEKNNSTTELIVKALSHSTSFWHSLCLLTTADFTDVSKKLTIEQIQGICSKTEVIIVGAYDGEGYIFWEKNSTAHPFGGLCLA